MAKVPVNEPQLARVFALALKADLLDGSSGNLQEIVDRNSAESDPLICHSHDFVDANQTMLLAWGILTGEDAELDEAMPIMQRAWDIAKANRFFLPASKKPHQIAVTLHNSAGEIDKKIVEVEEIDSEECSGQIGDVIELWILSVGDTIRIVEIEE